MGKRTELVSVHLDPEVSTFLGTLSKLSGVRQSTLIKVLLALAVLNHQVTGVDARPPTEAR